MNPLVDATEMYLRTIWELQEEGITPLRARLVERLGVSAPSVSETVARLADEGLVAISANRRLELTDEGRRIAVSVMRKHRLVERLLTDVVELDWEHVHVEACRWEHVISTRVENRLVRLLERPARDPHGNPIPGLGEGPTRATLRTLPEAVDYGSVRIERISEHLQGDVVLMAELRAAGATPGEDVTVTAGPDGLTATGTGGAVTIDRDRAALVYVLER